MSIVEIVLAATTALTVLNCYSNWVASQEIDRLVKHHNQLVYTLAVFFKKMEEDLADLEEDDDA